MQQVVFLSQYFCFFTLAGQLKTRYSSWPQMGSVGSFTFPLSDRHGGHFVQLLTPLPFTEDTSLVGLRKSSSRTILAL